MKKVYDKGWDISQPDPGVEKTMRCKVCDTKMDVTRSVQRYDLGRPTDSKCDYFRCPHTGEDWHEQAKAILKEAGDTASNWLYENLSAEAFSITCNRKPRKPTSR